MTDPLDRIDSPIPPRRGRPPNIPRPEPMQQRQVSPELADEAPAPRIALEDPRARAARRALELREHLGDMDQGTDEYAIDPRIIPAGWSYEWKTKSVLAQEQTSYIVGIQQRGWENVPTSRHPEMMPKGHPLSAPIEKKGMMLMERPLEITEEVKRIELRKARGQVNQKEAQLNNAPQGTFQRDNKGAPLTNIKKNYDYEPITVPK